VGGGGSGRGGPSAAGVGGRFARRLGAYRFGRTAPRRGDTRNPNVAAAGRGCMPPAPGGGDRPLRDGQGPRRTPPRGHAGGTRGFLAFCFPTESFPPIFRATFHPTPKRPASNRSSPRHDFRTSLRERCDAAWREVVDDPPSLVQGGRRPRTCGGGGPGGPASLTPPRDARDPRRRGTPGLPAQRVPGLPPASAPRSPELPPGQVMGNVAGPGRGEAGTAPLPACSRPPPAGPPAGRHPPARRPGSGPPADFFREVSRRHRTSPQVFRGLPGSAIARTLPANRQRGAGVFPFPVEPPHPSNKSRPAWSATGS